MKRWLCVLTAASLLFAAGCAENRPLHGSSATDAPAGGEYMKITSEEAKAIIDGGGEFVLLDVRTAEEYAEAHIKGAMLIPDGELASRAESELPDKNAEILVYCRSGRRSAASAKLLVELGYTRVKDFGGIIDWPYETVTGTDPMGEGENMQYFVDKSENVVYLAGGCFWGIEKLMESIPGVVDAKSGYANGSGAEEANYRRVTRGDTGFRETVRVEYDPEKVSLDAILLAFFYVIDTTAVNRQGNDVGTQYQSGVYYTNDAVKAVVERIAAIESGRSKAFAVEIGPLVNFFDAEDYHQDYLVKNPDGYCHIPTAEIELFSKLVIDPGDYQRPADELIREKLSDLQYSVTMENGTERAFSNEYWDFFEKGIYVDIVTGEPLFVSTDKFESGCGWPAFSKPIEEPAVIEKYDDSYGMRRTEVRSRAGDTHLGHVFTDDPESPNGVRYCINSASLRFVSYEKMEEEGYGYLLYLFDS